MVITGDDLVAELLELYRVRIVFGLTGDHDSNILDAVKKSNKIQYFSAQSAQAAVFMADGYARATGNIGVCLLSGEYAAVSAVPGIASSNADNIPLLVLTEQMRADDPSFKSPMERHRDPINHVDSQKLFEAVTKWHWRVENREEIRHTIGQAFEIIEHGSPGPVHLEIPSDVLEGESTEFLPSRGSISQSAPLAAYFNMLTSHLTTLVAEMMTHAKYPAIIAGGGVVSARAGTELIQLAEILNAPVYTTPMSKGVIPSAHPLAAGLVGAAIDNPASSVICQANAVMAIGCGLSRRTTRDGQLRLPRDLVQIDIEEKAIGRNYPVRIGMVADAKTALRQIIEVIDEESLETHNEWEISITGSGAVGATENSQGANRQIAAILRASLNEEAILAVSGDYPIEFLIDHFEVSTPRTLLHSCDLRTAGYALPCAIGAKVAHQDRQIVAVTDREEFSLMASELTTAAQKGINVTVLVVGTRQRSPQPDVKKLSESFGLHGVRVETIAKLRPTLDSVLHYSETSVVDVPLLD
ncbi:MAG: thiamine pyrophosphate-binding protein [Candidatus Poribacteria bacterium]|nr:thiamine pyrophosphate-binding protein [Candidatus Poribacteria bacterium]MDE0504508.1 thiamine pyrophosphate-binding protein [Candidatus Poribacteria bacterium]